PFQPDMLADSIQPQQPNAGNTSRSLKPSTAVLALLPWQGVSCRTREKKHQKRQPHIQFEICLAKGNQCLHKLTDRTIVQRFQISHRSHMFTPKFTELVPRQRSRGKQLESLSRGLGTKIPIQISDGKRRPEPPIQAAKFASEGGIILRQHIPIFPHWKEYKKQENEGKITDYIGKLAGQFTMDVDSNSVKDACVDMLKGGQRQMRLAPRGQNNCVKNKLNREKVQFPQCTGSQSYVAKAYVVRQEKYKDVEPSAIDLFKEMHCSKKKGFSEVVQKAI
ncbi:hypothetical protein ACJX0J_041851, partial [Zea mays]